VTGGGEAGLPVTPLGTLDGPPGAAVDARGVVTVDGRWSLDWWIGADDRWHLAGREPTARQQLVGDAPVVETRLRVPGGDAVHRTYGARDAQGHDHVVVEVENASRVPFAVAFVFRSDDLTGRRTATGGFRADGWVVTSGGRTIALLPRAPARAAGATGWADVVDVVTSGAAAEALGDAATGEGASAALLFPLAHTASVRIVLPVGDDPRAGELPPVPTAQQVAAGWTRLAEQGAQVQVPDSGLAAGVRAARAQLLLRGHRTAKDAPRIMALDHEGFHDEAARILRAVGAAEVGWRRVEPEAAAALLDAASRHWAVTRDDRLAEELLPLLAVLARRAEKDAAAAPRAMHRFADLLDGLGQPDAARAVRPAAPLPAPSLPGWEQLDGLRRSASPTWTWAQPDGRDEFLAAVRGVLLAEVDGELAVLPDGLGPWTGQPVELHRAPTAFGAFSYAVRWHGDRPALLWELDAHPGPGAVRITAPGLDARWRSDERKGEDLLGATRDDGAGTVDPGESFT
jgi:hypothetical protein